MLILCVLYVHNVHIGERRIRVHTLSLPVSSQLSDIYAKLNIQAIAGVLGNMGELYHRVGRLYK